MTGKRARTRNNAERNIAIAEVGAEGERVNCKNGHTYADMKIMQITTAHGMVGRMREAEKNGNNVAMNCVECGGIF